MTQTDSIRSALEAAREALRLLLATPEIADAHPADKDEETHVAERKARASLAQIDAALSSLDAPQGEGRFARLSPDAPAQIPEGYSAPLDMRTTRQLIAERERSAPAPAPDALREAVEALEPFVLYANKLAEFSEHIADDIRVSGTRLTYGNFRRARPARAYAAVNYGTDQPEIAWQTMETHGAKVMRTLNDLSNPPGYRIERVVVLREADYLELVKRSEGK